MRAAYERKYAPRVDAICTSHAFICRHTLPASMPSNNVRPPAINCAADGFIRNASAIHISIRSVERCSRRDFLFLSLALPARLKIKTPNKHATRSATLQSVHAFANSSIFTSIAIGLRCRVFANFRMSEMKMPGMKYDRTLVPHAIPALVRTFRGGRSNFRRCCSQRSVRRRQRCGQPQRSSCVMRKMHKRCYETIVFRTKTRTFKTE